jgi:hypothetical protein
MAKVTGYEIIMGKGPKKCIKCGTKMMKGLPYMSAVTGGDTKWEHDTTSPMQGKSLCILCLELLVKDAKDMMKGKKGKKEQYENKRFADNL